MEDLAQDPEQAEVGGDRGDREVERAAQPVRGRGDEAAPSTKRTAPRAPRGSRVPRTLRRARPRKPGSGRASSTPARNGACASRAPRGTRSPTNATPQARAFARMAAADRPGSAAKGSVTATPRQAANDGQGERENGPGVEAVRRRQKDQRDEQQVVRPAGAENPELRLHVGEVRGQEQNAEQEHVVHGDVRGLDTLPRERRGAAKDVDEARRRGGSEQGGDRRRAQPLVVLLEKEADARPSRRGPPRTAASAARAAPRRARGARRGGEARPGPPTGCPSRAGSGFLRRRRGSDGAILVPSEVRPAGVRRIDSVGPVTFLLERTTPCSRNRSRARVLALASLAVLFPWGVARAQESAAHGQELGRVEGGASDRSGQRREPDGADGRVLPERGDQDPDAQGAPVGREGSARRRDTGPRSTSSCSA